MQGGYYSNAPDVRAQTNESISNGAARISGLWGNPQIQAMNKLRMQQVQNAAQQFQTLQMQNAARGNMASDYALGVKTGNWNPLMGDRLVLEGMGNPEEFLKGAGIAMTPGGPQAAAFAPIKGEPGEKIFSTSQDPRFNQPTAPAPAPTDVTSPSGGLFSAPNGAPAPSQTGGPNVVSVGGKMLGGKELDEATNAQQAAIKIQMAEQAIRDNPGSLGGLSHNIPAWLANKIPQGWPGSVTPQTQQQNAQLSNMFSEIGQERAGVRGMSSPTAITQESTFLPVVSGAWNHLADNDQNALNKLKALDATNRADYGALSGTLGKSGYQVPPPLPPQLPGMGSTLSQGAPTADPGSAGGLIPNMGTPPQAALPQNGSLVPNMNQGAPASQSAPAASPAIVQSAHAQALQWLQQNPNDPSAPAVKAQLQAAGLLPTQPAPPAPPANDPSQPPLPTGGQ